MVQKEKEIYLVNNNSTLTVIKTSNCLEVQKASVTRFPKRSRSLGNIRNGKIWKEKKKKIGTVVPLRIK